MAVDGYGNNAVEEVDCVYAPGGSKGDFDNVFGPVSTPLTSEKQAVRMADASKARAWKITNPGKLNPITGKPVAGTPTHNHSYMSNKLTNSTSGSNPLTTNVRLTVYITSHTLPQLLKRLLILTRRRPNTRTSE